MSCRSIGLLISMLTAVSSATLYRDPDSTTEWSSTESVREAMQGAGDELGALLDAGDGAVVTLEAGGTRLVAHRAVLAARSPVLLSMLPHHSGRLSVPGVGGAALRHLLAYLYTLRAPPLPPGTATQLLAAAHRLGLPALQADCERQVAEQLSVETAASAAVLAVKHSANHLRDAAVNFVKDHRIKVLATKGWADALKNQPKEAAEVSHLLADRIAEICTPATIEAGTTTTTEAGTTTTTEAGTTTTTEAGTTTTAEAGTTTTTEAGTTASTQPHSGATQTPATAALALAACPTAPLDEATVSRLRSLSGKDRDRRLIQAAEEGTLGELRMLLAAGADVGARNSVGWTGLHYAARRGRVEAASCLLGAGAQVDARDKWQHTPLHWAAYGGHVAVARLLLAASADPNARNDQGTTPLHFAAMDGRADLVAALLEAGADRGAKDARGWTPLDIARRNDHQHLFEMLMQR